MKRRRKLLFTAGIVNFYDDCPPRFNNKKPAFIYEEKA